MHSFAKVYSVVTVHYLTFQTSQDEDPMKLPRKFLVTQNYLFVMVTNSVAEMGFKYVNFDY